MPKNSYKFSPFVPDEIKKYATKVIDFALEKFPTVNIKTQINLLEARSLAYGVYAREFIYFSNTLKDADMSLLMYESGVPLADIKSANKEYSAFETKQVNDIINNIANNTGGSIRKLYNQIKKFNDSVKKYDGQLNVVKYTEFRR